MVVVVVVVADVVAVVVVDFGVVFLLIIKGHQEAIMIFYVNQALPFFSFQHVTYYVGGRIRLQQYVID